MSKALSIFIVYSLCGFFFMMRQCHGDDDDVLVDGSKVSFYARITAGLLMMESGVLVLDGSHLQEGHILAGITAGMVAGRNGLDCYRAGKYTLAGGMFVASFCSSLSAVIFIYRMIRTPVMITPEEELEMYLY
jgi:hypothetical protein